MKINEMTMQQNLVSGPQLTANTVSIGEKHERFNSTKGFLHVLADAVQGGEDISVEQSKTSSLNVENVEENMEDVFMELIDVLKGVFTDEEALFSDEEVQQQWLRGNDSLPTEVEAKLSILLETDSLNVNHIKGFIESEKGDLSSSLTEEKLHALIASMMTLFAAVSSHFQKSEERSDLLVKEGTKNTTSHRNNIETGPRLATLLNEISQGLNVNGHDSIQKTASKALQLLQSTSDHKGGRTEIGEWLKQIVNPRSDSQSSIDQSDFLQQLLKQSGNREVSSTVYISSSISEASPSMGKTEQLAFHLGDNKPAHAQRQEFIKHFQNMLNKGNLQAFKNGNQQLSIKLYPESLGRMDVKLSRINGEFVAHILTTTKAAKDIVESQLHQLRQSLSQQNIQVDKIEVQQQQPTLQDRGTREEPSSEQQSQQEERSDRQEKEDDEDNEHHSFADLIDELTFNEQV